MVFYGVQSISHIILEKSVNTSSGVCDFTPMAGGENNRSQYFTDKNHKAEQIQLFIFRPSETFGMNERLKCCFPSVSAGVSVFDIWALTMSRRTLAWTVTDFKFQSCLP